MLFGFCPILSCIFIVSESHTCGIPNQFHHIQKKTAIYLSYLPVCFQNTLPQYLVGVLIRRSLSPQSPESSFSSRETPALKAVLIFLPARRIRTATGSYRIS